MYREHMPTLPRREDKNDDIDQSSIYDRPGAKYEFQKFVFRGHKRHYTDMPIHERCEMCDKAISEGEYITVQPFSFHVECCRCTKCNKYLGGENEPMYKANKNLWCEDCKEGVCCLCSQEITAGQGFIKYLDRYAHRRCFNCYKCGKKLKSDYFFLVDEQPACEEHGAYLSDSE